MNSSASEEILSAAEVPETNQVTVTTVTTTSTTNTQTVAGTRACHIPLFTVMLHSKLYLATVTSHLVTSRVLLITRSAPLTFLGQIMQLHLLRHKRPTMYIAWYDHANHVTRRAYEKGWISKARVKKIFHRGLEESFEGYRDGYLPPLYLDNMINYGKFYKYLSRC